MPTAHFARSVLRLLIAGALGCVTACGASGNGNPAFPTPKRVPFASADDVEARNLPPEKEIDSLLRGDPEAGTVEGALRVAVPPFKVQSGDKHAWLGEAVAQIVADGLSRVDGVSLLERAALGRVIEEHKKNAESGAPSAGKLVGANVLVVGTLVPAGEDRYRVTAYPVRVEDGVRLQAAGFDVDVEDPSNASQPAIASILTQLGLRSTPTAAPAPLPAKSVELAARARELQFSGRLLEAQPLYATALAEPSSAWAYEADYVSLMADLGMKDWAIDRAARVLSRIPVSPGTSCARARLVTERARMLETGAVTEARKAVRLAASCGDGVVVAQALVALAWATESLCYPLARQALERASALLGRDSGRNAYTRCVVDTELYRFSADNGNAGGDEAARYVERADACERSGNLRLAALTLGNAAAKAWDGPKQVALQRRAVRLARTVGGKRLDVAELDLARSLRAMGRVADADDLLIAGIGRHLAAITKLHGGLPDPERRLDADLLVRAKVRSGPSDRVLQGPTELLARAHRKALAGILREWAERTRVDSRRQADVYTEIANKLDPLKPRKEGLSGDALYEARLAEAKLPLSKIAELDRAPLWGSDFAPWEAYWTLHDWFWALRGSNAPLERRADVVKASAKLAAFIDRPQLRWTALRLEATHETDRGRPKNALAVLHSADALLVDLPRERYWQLWARIEAQDKLDRSKSQALRDERVKVARKVNVTSWLDALSQAGYAGIGGDGQAVEGALGALDKAAQELESAKSWEAAGQALRLRADLARQAAHAEGTEESARLYLERARVLDQLGDPLRSLIAHAEAADERARWLIDVYRGGAAREIARDEATTQLVKGITDATSALAGAGRAREAVRVVVRLPPEAAGMPELVAKAFGWARDFQDSAEHPALMAQLHGVERMIATDEPARQKAGQLARDAWLEAGDAHQAVLENQGLLADIAREKDLFDALGECLAIAKNDPLDRAECYWGVGKSVMNHRYRSAEDRQRFVSAATAVSSLMPAVDAGWIPERRMSFRTTAAVFAALAGDLTAVRRWNQEVRTYYTATAPNAYMLSTHLSRAGVALETSQPAMALELYQEFDRTGGASDYWRASVYAQYAKVAARAGNAEEEKRFLGEGRRLTAIYPRFLLSYDMYGASETLEKKKWSELEKIYAEVEKKTKERYPSYHLLLKQLQVSRAVASAMAGNAARGQKQLDPWKKHALATSSAEAPGESPCFDTQILEIAAGLARAAGRCKEADELGKAAERLRARCVKRTCHAAPTGAEWCDGPDPKDWRATNACNKRFAGDTSFLPR